MRGRGIETLLHQPAEHVHQQRDLHFRNNLWLVVERTKQPVDAFPDIEASATMAKCSISSLVICESGAVSLRRESTTSGDLRGTSLGGGQGTQPLSRRQMLRILHVGGLGASSR